MKRLAVIAVVLTALLTASAALAAHTPLPVDKIAQNAYPLTITQQPPVAGGGNTTPYVIIVTNHSTKMHIDPLVYLDTMATIASANHALIQAFNAAYGMTVPTWHVGTLWPGQSATLELWYNGTVTFPGWTDPYSGKVFPPTTHEVGINGYQPAAMMYDNFFHLYSYANSAAPITIGGGK